LGGLIKAPQYKGLSKGQGSSREAI
jgi:hypothetical protein